MSMVEYRNMRDDDLDQVIALWMKTWGYSDAEFAIRRIKVDPGYLEHTLLALSPAGKLLATVHYWLFDLRDHEGKPRRVGCVSHVVTVEAARRQGHAHRLMEMALEQMPRDGCEWTLLFASDMGLPLYEQLGYKLYSAPFKRGMLSGTRPALNGTYTVEQSNVTANPDYWREIAPIYEAYNRNRPLSNVRDEAYWKGLYVRRLERPSRNYRIELFLARNPEDGRAAGYTIAHIWNEGVAYPLGVDQLVTFAELAVLPGEEAAIPHLLAAVADAAVEGRVGITSFLPHEPAIDKALDVLLQQPIEVVDDRNVMARTLPGGLSEEELKALMTAPNSISWMLDEF